MAPAIAFIVALLTIVVGVSFARFGSLSAAWRYLRQPERRVVWEGIRTFIGVGILVGLLSLAFCSEAHADDKRWTWFNYSYIYLGVDYPMLNRVSPQCENDGIDNKTTSNGGATLNIIRTPRFYRNIMDINAKYTHHSCAFNSDRNLYDAAGVEVIWYFFDRRKR